MQRHPPRCWRPVASPRGASLPIRWERHVQQRGHARQIDPHAGELASPVLVWRRRHAVLAEEVVEPLPVGFGDQLPQAARIEPALVGADVLLGDQQVDAVWAPVGRILDPGQVRVEMLRVVGHGTEHAHTAGLGDGSDDVPAVAEPQDGELERATLLFSWPVHCGRRARHPRGARRPAPRPASGRQPLRRVAGARGARTLRSRPAARPVRRRRGSW